MLNPDFTFSNHGTIMVLYPHTDEAKAWAGEHLPEDAQKWGSKDTAGTVIEPRYFEPILEGLLSDGLTIMGEI